IHFTGYVDPPPCATIRHMPEARPVLDRAAAVRPTHVRHVVLGLTVAAYMITYMDRVNISSAVPVIQKEFGFSLVTIAWILSAFRWGYALFQIPGGWLGDRIGPRRALALIVTWWSVFTSVTALAWNAASMAAIRFLFGMAKPAHSPSPRDRFHAGCCRPSVALRKASRT